MAAGLWLLAYDEDPGQDVFVAPIGLRALELPTGQSTLYPPNDPWASFLAPDNQCPEGESRDAPLATQRLTMICLLNWARRMRGLPQLRESRVLSQAALRKAQDIYRCRDFAHAACGKEPRDVADAVGYRGVAWGENLYLGTDRLGAPRVATDRWLNSPGHRENLFRRRWDEQGIAVLQAPEFGGYHNAAIWVSHFGQID